MEMPPTSAEYAKSVVPAEDSRLRGAALASVLTALMLTLLLSALDQTIVGTALPRIIGDLHGFDRYIWVVTAYLVTSTTMIPIVGKLSDQFGRKWFLVAGVVIFLVGSALSGTSQTMNQLIIFRGLQGIGAGTVLSLVFTLVGDIFVPAERARWQGLFSGVFALASVVGPATGGWITDNTSWRWVFYVNLPLGALALLLLIFKLPTHISAPNRRYRGWAAIRRIDFAGVFTAAGATISLMLGLTWGGTTYAWNSPQVLGVLVGAAVLFAVFAIIEAFFAVEPILPLDLFKNQVFAAGALLSLTVGMALFAVVFYLPLFIQGVLGQTATSSGAVITPLTVTMAVGAIFVGQLIARIGRYQAICVVGALVLTFGVYLLSRMTVSVTLGVVTRNMIVVGLGLGMLMPVLTLAVQNAIPRSRLGVGTGAVTYLRSMGQMLGVALIGAVVSNSVSGELAKRLPPAASKLPPQVTNPNNLQQLLVSPTLQHQVVTTVTQAAIEQARIPAIIQALETVGVQVPPGPNRWMALNAITQQVDQQVTTQVTQQVHELFAQMLDATRQSLAIGIGRAFTAGLFICGAVVVISLFLKDVPLAKREAAPSVAQAIATGEAALVDGVAETDLVPSGAPGH
ncbi:MAG: MFS transporter [Ktedonobacterales bacterium]|nr:MFS transporter [Ktedonobacterales bacterium]